MAVLVGVSPEFQGKVFHLEEDVVGVGRNPENAVPVDNHTVSGSHCALTRQGDTYELKDLGSTNGTRVNSQPLAPEEPVVLKDRDVVHFGAMEFIFAMEVPDDLDEIIRREAQSAPEAPEEPLSSGPMTTPMSFDNVSPFGARKTETKGTWSLLIIIVGVLALLGVLVLFYFLFVASS